MREQVSEYLKALPKIERLGLANKLSLSKNHIWCATSMTRRKRRNQFVCPQYAIEIIAKHAGLCAVLLVASLVY